MQRSSGPAGTRAKKLQWYLHEQIPNSKAMGVRVLHTDPSRIVLCAPLRPNLNHRQTFFGGSAASLATLAAWALAHERLSEPSNLALHVVIQRSTMQYLEPAAVEVEAECVAPADREWDRLLRSARRWGKARIQLEVKLSAAGKVVGSFEGDFVALVQ